VSFALEFITQSGKGQRPSPLYRGWFDFHHPPPRPTSRAAQSSRHKCPFSTFISAPPLLPSTLIAHRVIEKPGGAARWSEVIIRPLRLNEPTVSKTAGPANRLNWVGAAELSKRFRDGFISTGSMRLLAGSAGKWRKRTNSAASRQFLVDPPEKNHKPSKCDPCNAGVTRNGHWRTLPARPAPRSPVGGTQQPVSGCSLARPRPAKSSTKITKRFCFEFRNNSNEVIAEVFFLAEKRPIKKAVN